MRLKASTAGEGGGPSAKCEPVDHILDWLKLTAAGPVVELRAIGVSRAGTDAKHVERSVYKTDADGLRRLAKDARAISPRAEGVYITMNELRPDLADGESAADADVLRRHWLLVDADPVRPADTSATDNEKQHAWLLVQSVRDHLESLGWPQPIVADSGNGFHLLYRIDLPADDGGLVERTLKALAARFDSPAARIDPTVCNPSRIRRLYGTIARKGPSTAERPHRTSIVLEAFSPMEVVPAALVEAVAAEAKVEAAPKAKPATKAKPGPRRLRLRDLGDDPVSAHATAALEAEAEMVATAANGHRNHQLFKSAAALNELVNAGALDGPTVEGRLTDAARLVGLGDHEIGQTLRSARKRTDGKARDLSHVGNGDGSGKPGGRKPRSKGFVTDPITGVKESIDDERRLARLVLRDHGHHPDGPTLRYWNGDWHAWRAGAWRIVDDKEINARITGVAKREFEAHAKLVGSEVRGVGTRLVANVANMLRAIILKSIHDIPNQPEWLDMDGPNPAECLNCRNGILHLPTLITEGPEKALTLPTPGFFAPAVLDYDFDPNAPKPVNFLRFLDSIGGDDPELIRALQQWFGYLLTPDTSLQKVLMVVGPPRSGKGTLGRLLVDLIGRNNVASPTLSSLGGRFGSQELIGKTVAIIAEARLAGHADTRAIVERILSISGEDHQSIERKHTTNWFGRLLARLILFANEPPHLSDYSDALMSRLIVLRLNQSFVGREDPDLSDKLRAERSGILLWSIAGWEDLRVERRLIQPKSGEAEKAEIRELANPVGAFVAERLEIGPDLLTPRPRLYEEWTRWCKENGRDRPGSAQGFLRSLRAALAARGVEIDESQPRADDGTRQRVVAGVGLRADATPF